jgi:VanZ family protein
MPVKSWQRRPSAFARQGLVGYVLLIVYASLYPFSGWRAIGVGPFAYLAAPLPQYMTAFDVVTNVIGYLPLGTLTVLSVYPRVRGALAVALGFALGALLSGTMEAIQTYLPTRVASNLDLASNSLGALFGAAAMAPATSALLDRGLLRRVRFIWFERQTSVLLLIVALWPFAQIFPAPFLFGTGAAPRAAWEALDPPMRDVFFYALPLLADVAGRTHALAARLPGPAWEAIVTALNVFGAALLASVAMRARAPRVRLVAGGLAATFAIKIGASYLQSKSGLTFDWGTTGAFTGTALGAALTLIALPLRAAWRGALAAIALVASLLLVNLLPVNPYYDAVLADWRQGRYLHFNGLAQWLAWIWPYAALGWAVSRVEWAAVQRWRARRAR